MTLSCAVPLKSDPSDWTDERQIRGLKGEKIAKRYLISKGWRILHHRYRMGHPEIDLIVRKGDTVAFVEVKTRWTRSFGDPLEAVGPRKRREIARVAASWIDRHGRERDEYRFDVVGVMLRSKEKGGPMVAHVTDAFRAGWR